MVDEFREILKEYRFGIFDTDLMYGSECWTMNAVKNGRI